MVFATVFRTQKLGHPLGIRCRYAFQHFIMVVYHLPNRTVLQLAQPVYGRPTVVQSLAVIIISERDTAHLIVTCHVFGPGQQAVAVVGKQVIALVPGNLAERSQETYSQLGMLLVSPAFLPLPEHRSIFHPVQIRHGITDASVPQAVLEIFNPFPVNVRTVAQHSDGSQSDHVASIPVCPTIVHTAAAMSPEEIPAHGIQIFHHHLLETFKVGSFP